MGGIHCVMLAVTINTDSATGLLTGVVGVMGMYVQYRLALLKRRDDQQQATIDQQQVTIGDQQVTIGEQGEKLSRQGRRISKLQAETKTLTDTAKTERDLKHECRGRLWGAWIIVQLYRKAFKQIPEDTMEEPTAPIDPLKTAPLNTLQHDQQFPGEPPRVVAVSSPAPPPRKD